jgi:beta-mannosidase
MNRRLNLNGVWKLRWHDGQRGDRPERLLGPDADLSRAFDATVPGEVHETLIQRGLLDDPNVGANVLRARWVEEMFWHYRRTFRAPKLRRGERAWLVFEGLDLAAEIYLNGREVGRHANYFHPCRLDVTEALAAGQNVLVVRLESGLFHAANRSVADLEERHIDHQLTKRPWLRKPQSPHGWDWSPRLLNVGIHGNVYLEIARSVRWDNCVVLSELSDDLAAGKVTARVFVEGLERKSRKTTLTVDVAGVRLKKPVVIKPGLNMLELTVPVARPKLWWPVGHGAQPRYTVKVALAGIGSAMKRVGFRHVRVNQEPHPEQGRYFIIEINGRPIFCKGGNFVPADLILTRLDRQRYKALVDRALEANCNFFRVWGGGLYESDDFYELCDERGILVWQEFIFACSRYPATDEAFLADVKREATYQIRRLAHHPSLIVWCGNNEMEEGNWHWGFEKGAAHPDHALFHMVLPVLLKQEDPTRYYQPSSPFSPDHADPRRDDVGDQHPWSIGFADTDFRKYRDMICRFPNEGGILGPTALPTVRACTSKIASFEWELHDNSVSYWGGMRPWPDTMLEQWLGKRLKDMSIEDYVYWGGVVQGAGLAEYVKNFRRRMFSSAGAIFWMYNDVWPATRSWTIVDYYQRRTPAFWPVKRAFAPVIVVVTREGDRVRVFGVNDGPAMSGALRYGLLALAGKYPLDKTLPVRLPANASALIAEFDAGRWSPRTHLPFAILSVAGREVARDALILPLFKDMEWLATSVNVRWRGGKAIFTSDRFAWRVCLDLDGERALPDNFFDVYPGIPTVLDWPARLGKPRVVRVGQL